MLTMTFSATVKMHLFYLICTPYSHWYSRREKVNFKNLDLLVILYVTFRFKKLFFFPIY